MRPILMSILLLFSAIIASPAIAKDRDTSTAEVPAVYGQLAECRKIADNAARLACFDAAAAAMDKAIADKDVFMIDKAQAKKTKRSLFGLSLPNLGIFGGDEDKPGGEADTLDEITATIKSARFNGESWTVTLDDGSTWRQIDTSVSGIDLKAGMQVTIKKASMGSYRLMYSKHKGVKVRRVI